MSSTLVTTLALKTTSMSHFSVKMLGFAGFILAQGDLTSQMSTALGILNLVGLVLAFGGLLFAAVMFMMGQTERMIYGLIGALIGGLSFLIVKAMFSGSGGSQVNALNLS